MLSDAAAGTVAAGAVAGASAGCSAILSDLSKPHVTCPEFSRLNVSKPLPPCPGGPGQFVRGGPSGAAVFFHAISELVRPPSGRRLSDTINQPLLSSSRSIRRICRSLRPVSAASRRTDGQQLGLSPQ